jgi:hypothetical protein
MRLKIDCTCPCESFEYTSAAIDSIQTDLIQTSIDDTNVHTKGKSLASMSAPFLTSRSRFYFPPDEYLLRRVTFAA